MSEPRFLTLSLKNVKVLFPHIIEKALNFLFTRRKSGKKNNLKMHPFHPLWHSGSRTLPALNWNRLMTRFFQQCPPSRSPLTTQLQVCRASPEKQHPAGAPFILKGGCTSVRRDRIPVHPFKMSALCMTQETRIVKSNQDCVFWDSAENTSGLWICDRRLQICKFR